MENRALFKAYTDAINMLDTFDKDYLSRIRTGNTDSYGEIAQSQLYQKLMKQFGDCEIDFKQFIFDAKMYASEIGNLKRETEVKHTDWEINPNIIARLDKVIELYREKESDYQM